MHGSSSVPQEWLKIINEYGGEIGETYGAGRGDRRGHQVRRTQGQHRHRPASGLHRRDPRVHGEEPQRVRPAQVPAKTVAAMRDICIARYEAPPAMRSKPISLEGMFQRYANGELDPKIN